MRAVAWRGYVHGGRRWGPIRLSSCAATERRTGWVVSGRVPTQGERGRRTELAGGTRRTRSAGSSVDPATPRLIASVRRELRTAARNGQAAAAAEGLAGA